MSTHDAVAALAFHDEQNSALSDRVIALESALGLAPGQDLCGAEVGPDGQPCLKAAGHTEIVGQGWHSGIAWTRSN